jgi:hypothetical protein
VATVRRGPGRRQRADQHRRRHLVSARRPNRGFAIV